MLGSISNVFLQHIPTHSIFDHNVFFFFFCFLLFERSHCPDPYIEKATSDEEISGQRNKRDFELTLPDLLPKNSKHENISKLYKKNG